METDPAQDAGAIECCISIPRRKLRGLRATVEQLHRLGASVSLCKQDLKGYSLAPGEGFELDIRLPENGSFPPRTLNALGSVLRTGDGVEGRQWVVVRFHSLQFRGTGAGRQREDSASL